MANELANATVLMGDPTFRDWMRAAVVYQARNVLIEDPATASHAQRAALAKQSAIAPNTHLDMFVNAVACDQTVASIGTSVGSSPGQVDQPTILSKVSALWTPIGELMYPNG